MRRPIRRLHMFRAGRQAQTIIENGLIGGSVIFKRDALPDDAMHGEGKDGKLDGQHAPHLIWPLEFAEARPATVAAATIMFRHRIDCRLGQRAAELIEVTVGNIDTGYIFEFRAGMTKAHPEGIVFKIGENEMRQQVKHRGRIEKRGIRRHIAGNAAPIVMKYIEAAWQRRYPIFSF